MMSVLVRNKEQNKNLLLVKGAAERIIDNSTTFMNVEGKKEDLTEEMKKKLKDQVTKLASQGLRILGMAFKEGEELGIINNMVSTNEGTNPAL